MLNEAKLVTAVGGEEVTPIVGSYGIGLERILTACIEQNHDEHGFWLRASIAPFDVVITPFAAGSELLAKAVEVGSALERAGLGCWSTTVTSVRASSSRMPTWRCSLPHHACKHEACGGKFEVLTRGIKQREDIAIGAVVGHMQSLIRG